MKEEQSIKQTALFHWHQQAGASLTEHHGWRIPASFTSPESEAGQVREAVGLADVSWMMKFDLKGYGLKTPPAFGGRERCWILGPLHVLITCDPSARDDVLGQLEHLQAAAFNLQLPAPVYVTEVTSVYAQLLLAGPRSREVLWKLTSLNLSEASLPHLPCGQASVAHVHAIVLRQNLGRIPAFHLLVSREYAESVWDALLHAGHEFHLSPFGLRAQQLLQV